jgi:hypothetical protein
VGDDRISLLEAHESDLELGTHASSMVVVLYQLEALLAARRDLVQASRALVLAVDVVKTHDPLPDELQPGPASVATRSFAHDGLLRRRLYIQI